MKLFKISDLVCQIGVIWVAILSFLLGMASLVLADHEPLTAKVITDQAIEAHVNRLGPAAEGLDILPLSQVKSGGVLTWATPIPPMGALPQVATFADIQNFLTYSIERLIEVGLDQQTLARLHAEFQLLQAANMPKVFVWAEFSFPLGAVRTDRVNAKALPIDIRGVLNMELLFRLDLQ